MTTEEKLAIPEEFTKITKDFITDILITFPEYQPIVDKWWSPEEPSQEKVRYLFDHCIRVFPERFFDILYQKVEIFNSESQVNTEFLPGISFKYLWQCDISDKTRETIWKYLQMILICIVGSINNKDAFGDTSKLFDSINEDEFKGKLEETLGNIQNIFESMTKDENQNQGEGQNQGQEGTSGSSMPSADDIHGHLHSMMGGKLGDLAREIAEETSQNLNMDMDMENVTDVKDIFQKLFSNPGKLMGLVKNVSEKLDSRMKSGDINEAELMSEASEMISKMKNMPGMGNIQDMLSSLGMDGAGGLGNLAAMAGLGKKTKLDTNAMRQQLEKNAKNQAFKERMKKKMEAKQMAQFMQQAAEASALASKPAAPAMTDDELVALFSKPSPSESAATASASATSGKKKKKTKK